MRYLNPKADLTFKKVFGEHPDLIISFLNALLPFEKPEEEITQVEYLNPEMVPQTPFHKDSIVDVRCKDQSGRQFIVEMQMMWLRHTSSACCSTRRKHTSASWTKGTTTNCCNLSTR